MTSDPLNASACKRLFPERAFPSYSYVPGHFPHPISDPAGHSFGHEALKEPDLTMVPWQACPTYLYGVDLFNFGFYWEAHEAWESLWHACGRQGRTADLLKGLIKLAAAAVKVREGNRRGTKRHAERANELFDAAWSGLDSTELQLGLARETLRSFSTAICQSCTETSTPRVDYRLPMVIELA